VALFILQVLFSEQVKLRNAITRNSSLERKTQHHHHHIDVGSPSVHEPSSSQAGSNPHILKPRLDGLNMGRVSLEESWQSARSEIKALHHEIATLKSKFSELEHEHYAGMSQQVSSSSLTSSSSHFVFIGIKCIKLLLCPVKALETTISSVHPLVLALNI
jgi:hypothetical protein